MNTQMTKQETLQAVSKAQWIRLVDIYFLGPFMIFLALNEKKMCPYRRSILGLFGATTIWYNWKNYRENQERLQTMSGVYNNPWLNEKVLGEKYWYKESTASGKPDVEFFRSTGEKFDQKYFDEGIKTSKEIMKRLSRIIQEKTNDITNHALNKDTASIEQASFDIEFANHLLRQEQDNIRSLIESKEAGEMLSSPLHTLYLMKKLKKEKP